MIGHRVRPHLQPVIPQVAVDVAGSSSGADCLRGTHAGQGWADLAFVEPTQAEDPAGLFATLKAMVGDQDYDPELQRAKAAAIREECWQFRYRLWLARRYAPVRDEVSFLLGYCWSVVRPMAFELGRRMVEVGTFLEAEDTFYLVTGELDQAIEARQSGKALPQLGALAAERRELREARKKHRAPAVVPEEARANKDGPGGLRQDGAGIDPGFAVDHAGLDAAVCPCRQPGHRYGQYPRARFDCRARIMASPRCWGSATAPSASRTGDEMLDLFEGGDHLPGRQRRHRADGVMPTPPPYRRRMLRFWFSC